MQAETGQLPASRWLRRLSGQADSSAWMFSMLAGGAVIAFLLWRLDWALVSELDFSVIWEFRIAFLRGILLTLVITFVAISIGSLLGLVFAILLHAPIRPVRWVISAYVELFRNLPLIVIAFWIHFALPQVTGVSTSALQSGIIAISLQASAYLTDIARGGIRAVDKGQWDAARSLGIPAFSRWRDVILPQALRIMIPPLTNVSIGFLRASSILSVLSVGELMSTAARVSEYAYRPIEVFTFAGLLFFVMGSTVGFGAYRLERRLAKADR